MKKSIILLASVAMLASCSESATDSTPTTTGEEIKFSTLINPLAKVSTSTFDSGDAISVSAFNASGTQVADATTYTYNGSLFTSTDPIVYANEGDTYDIYAVYPPVSTLQSSLSFTALADQSSGDNFTQSDLLFASLSSSDAIPQLAFNHKMSSIVLNMAGGESGTLSLTAKTSVSYQFKTNVITASGSEVSVTPAENGTASYKVILAPQTVAKGTTLATFKYGDLTYDWVLDEALTLVSGTQYSYDWSLSDRTVTLKALINDWTSEDKGTIVSE